MYWPPAGMQRRRRRPSAAVALFLLVGPAGAAAPAAAQTNAPPQITTAGPFSANEGTTSVGILAATDDATAQADLIWSIPAGAGGGADAASFTLSEAGALAFAAAKDYETPDDGNADRTYEVTVQVSDGTDSDMAELLVTLLNVPELTAITGPSSVAFPENSWSRVATFKASSEEDRADIDWVLGGTDSDHFSIDSPPGALRFALDAVAPRIFSEPPDFEAPVDGDEANTYELTLLAIAGSSVTDTHTFTVTVTDVDEEGALSLSSTRPAMGAELTAVLTDPDGVAAGTALWQWERSTGRNSWAVIDGAAAASYTPAAADTNTFLRVTATYDDEHGTGKSVEEVVPNVVTGPLLTGLTVETDDTRVDTVRGLYPAFDSQTLHYRIGCSGANALLLTVSAPEHARLAVAVVHPPLPESLQPPEHPRLEAAGVQAARAPEVVSVPVTADSDVTIRVADASGAGTTYVVHCLPDVLFRIETHAFPDTEAFEDLILFNHDDYFRLMDRNGVPRQHLRFQGVSLSATRFHRVGADGAYRYGFALGREDGYTILDEDFEAVAEGVRTAAPLTHLDRHDFQILEDGNYLLMSYEPATRDFSDVDLPYLDGADVSSVAVLDAAFQIVTPGRLAVFTWKSWKHMAIEDCVASGFPVALSTDPNMKELKGDYAHINGAHVVDSVVVASMRGCSKVLGIDVRPGATRADVLWRMGRTNLSGSQWAARDIGPPPLDFINDPEGEFCGQHAARFLPNGNIFLFDNGVVCAIDPWTFEELGREGKDFSRAVEYALDLDNHEAVFVRDLSLRGERSHLGEFTGNVDALDNGDWLVSWGGIFGGGVEFPNVVFPNHEMATLVDPATGQEKLGIRFRELPTSFRQRLINATVVPSEALAPQPVPLTAEFPASDHTSIFHTGAGDAPQVVVAFNQPVADFSASSPSISVQGGAVESVGPHLEAGEPANAYVVVLTPDGLGPVTFSLVSGQSCASSGVCSAGGTVLSEVPAPHVIPLPPPVSVTATMTSDATHPTKDPFTVTIVFSEAVTGLAIGEITVTNGAASSLTGSGATYEVEIEPAAGIEADVTVTVAAGAVMDALNNANVLASAAFAADTKAPVLAVGGAAANGASLVLAWSEALDQTSTPGASAFAVTVDGAARTVSGVSLSGSTATLTLDPAVVRGNLDILVSYSPPSGNPLRDVRGNAAAALSGQAVTNDTPNAPPVGLPVVVGKTLVQEELTVSVAGITDADGLDDAVFSYQWFRSAGPADPATDAEIAGAVSMDYTLKPADQGTSIKVRVTFRDGGGTDEILFSEPTATVAALVTTFDASTALEESGTVTIGLSTGGISLAGDETVDLEFGGTATRGSDYRVDSDQLVLTAGSSMVETTLTLLDDEVDDDGETIEITARHLGRTVATHTVEIVDEDVRGVAISESTLPVLEGGAERYTVVLTSEPTALVDVRLTLAPASSDVSAAPSLLAFTAADWDAPQTVTVSAAEDDDAVADGSVAIRHEVSGGDYDSVAAAPVTVTIAENDVPTLSVADAEVSEGAPGGDLAVVFQVELSVPSDNEVTADYATSDGSGLEGAAAGSDYEATTGTVRFPALTTMAQPIRVPVTDDAVDEAELETFTLTLRNVSGASLAGGGPALRATGTIRDDDDPEVEASFGALRYEAPEGGSVTVTVRLSADPERLVTIPLLRTPVGGIAEHDYSGVPESIAFGSGQTAREFTFTATDDAADDDGEAVVLSFGSLPPRVSGSGETTLAIRDNDGGGGGGGSGGGGGGGAPPSDDEDEDEDEDDDGGGGGPPPPSGPPKADFTLSAACPEDLCRARTGSAVTFEDTSTGRVESRRWDFGDGTGSRNQRIDHAWSSPGFYEVTLSVSDGTSTSTTKQVFLVEASDPAGTCVADAGTLCLQDSRYAVAVEWRTADGNSGAGGVVHEGTNDSGLFRFFSEDNWEVLIKVLDGCALNGHVWVYGASTTDLGYTIRVTDTVTGTVKEYRNQPGLPAPAITDATAFPQGCQP